MPTVHEPFDYAAALSDMDEEPEAAILPVSFEDVADVAEEEEDTEPLETSLESLDEGQDDEEEDVFTLDTPVEDTDEDEEENFLDDEEDNVFEDDEV
jgi:hypothetical protein